MPTGPTWEQDIARRNRNSRALAWIVAAVMSIVADRSRSASLALLVPLKTFEPYMVVVDKATGFVEVKRPMAEARSRRTRPSRCSMWYVTSRRARRTIRVP